MRPPHNENPTNPNPFRYKEHMILKCSKLEYQKKCDELLKRIEILTKENDKLTKVRKYC